MFDALMPHSAAGATAVAIALLIANMLPRPFNVDRDVRRTWVALRVYGALIGVLYLVAAWGGSFLSIKALLGDGNSVLEGYLLAEFSVLIYIAYQRGATKPA